MDVLLSQLPAAGGDTAKAVLAVKNAAEVIIL